MRRHDSSNSLPVLFLALLTFTISTSATATDCPPTAAIKELFQANFEGPLPEGVNALPPKAKDAVQIVNANARQGHWSTQITVKNSSEYISDGHKIRAEYSSIHRPDSTYQSGDRRLYRFSLMLDQLWPFDSRDSIDLIWQFKRTDGPPDMFIAIKGHDLVLRIKESRQIKIISNLEPGKWIDIGLDVQFSRGANGSIKSYYRYDKNQNFIPSESDHESNLRSDTGKTYLKWGLYKPDNFLKSVAKNKPRTLFIDDIQVLLPNQLATSIDIQNALKNFSLCTQTVRK